MTNNSVVTFASMRPPLRGENQMSHALIIVMLRLRHIGQFALVTERCCHLMSSQLGLRRRPITSF